MTRVNRGISIDEDVLEENDKIRQAIGEQSEYGAAPDRSQLIETLLREWNEEHAHLLDEPEADSGNRLLAAMGS